MESGLVRQNPDTWRLGIGASWTFGWEGGHFETRGVAPDGSLVDVVRHRHEVELDIHRYEVSLSRTFGNGWDAVVRFPWMVKDQTAKVVLPSDASDFDRDAARRNGFIHHRTDTYEGFSDLEIAFGKRFENVLIDQDQLRLSLGVTLPVGNTEEDPWALGDAGLEHLHIQFGNGTFDPLLEAFYRLSINDDLGVSLFAKARLPFYHNSKGYRGAPELTFSPRVSWTLNRKVSVSGSLNFSCFGYSDWRETGRDQNSGLFALYAGVGGSYRFSDQLTGNAAVQFPLATKIYGSEDGLDPTPVFSLSLAYSF
ncbi:MAG: hypothetical protein AAF514_23195 [Verrucomicrobiota bacterium]